MKETKRQANARHARASYHEQRDQRAAAAVAMYESEQPDITVAQIARRIGTSARTITRYLQAAGIVLPKPKPKGRPKNVANIRRAHELRDLGKGNNEIARLMGISPAQASRYLKSDLDAIRTQAESGE